MRFLLLSMLFLSSCSFIRKDNLYFNLNNSSSMVMDEDLEDYSTAIHSFLVGNLAFENDDSNLALKEFDKLLAISNYKNNSVLQKAILISLRKNDLKAAIKKAKILEANQKNVKSLNLLASIFYAKGDYQDSQDSYLRSLIRNPKNLETLLLISALDMRDSNCSLAISYLNEILKIYPKNLIANKFLGYCYEFNQEFLEAEKQYFIAFNHHIKNKSLQEDIIRVFLKQKKYSELGSLKNKFSSKAKYVHPFLRFWKNKDNKYELISNQKFIEFNPFSYVNFKSVIKRVSNKKIIEAEQILLISLLSDPNNSDLRIYLSSFYAGLNKIDLALNQLLQINEKDKKFIKSRRLASFLYQQRDRPDKAIEVLKSAYKVNPNVNIVFSSLINLLRDNNKFSEALSLLEDKIKDNPEKVNLKFLYALTLWDLNKESESIAEMKKVLLLEPNNSDAMNFIAYSYAERERNLDEALSLINQALGIKKNDGYYLDTLGWVHYKRKEYEKALKIIAKAVDLIKVDPVILEHYGDILLETKHPQRALENYRNALELLQDNNIKNKNDKEIKKIRKKIDSL